MQKIPRFAGSDLYDNFAHSQFFIYKSTCLNKLLENECITYKQHLAWHTTLKNTVNTVVMLWHKQLPNAEIPAI
jgi:hypothetical protein